MTDLITTTDEQAKYNATQCTECGLRRFQHLNAVLCTEQQQVTLDDVFALLTEMRAELQSVKLFVDQLESAVKSHPMGKMLMG